MKILITGSNGQLGNELQKIISTGTAEIEAVSNTIKTAEVFAVDVDKLDITNLAQVKDVLKEINPDLIIAIDALASGSVERLNKTIQITDTGISPGGGIGNKRKEISYEEFGVKVIAIGVPTVVDAVTIVSDTINYMYKHYSYNKLNIKNPKNKLISALNNNYLKENIEVEESDKKSLLGIIGNFKEEELRELIFEVLTQIGYNLMVTPKEIDFIIEILSDIISSGINNALHENVDNL